MNMLLCKAQTKANLILKIHKAQLLFDASSNQIAIVTESSVEIQVFVYDELLNQYLTLSLLNQSFPFQILDSTIVSNHLLLLTICGLILFNYVNGAFVPIDYIKLNLSGEQRDLIMYLKTNSEKDRVIAYSNTNLFFVYTVLDNKLIRLNIDFFVTQFNICRVFDIKISNSIIGVFLLTKNDREYHIVHFFYDITSRKPIANEDCNDKNQYVQLMSTIEKELLVLDELDIYDFVFTAKSQYVFFISELTLLIYKIQSATQIEIVNKLHFESPKYYVGSLSFSQCNYIQLTFDTEVLLFRIEDDGLINQCNILLYDIKKRIEGLESLLLISESSTVLYYHFNSSLYFIQYDFTPQPKSKSNGTEVNARLLGDNVNQSIFAFDSAVIENADHNSVYAVCGSKGESRLIKYEDAYSETKLKEMRMLNVNNLFIISCSDCNSINPSIIKLCVFSYIDKASLFIMRKDFSIELIKDYDDIIVDMYSIPNSDARHAIVLRHYVIILQFDYSLDLSVNPLSKPNIIKSETSIPLTSKQAIILSSFYSHPISKVFYLICYVASNEIVISSIDSSSYSRIKELIRLNLGQAVTVSSMSSLQLNQTNDSNSSLSLLIGTYQSYLQLIHYDIDKNLYLILKENKYDIVPDAYSEKIVPESIKTVGEYIFFSTRTGEFCALRYDISSKKMERLLSHKFTSSSLCLHISHIEKSANGFSLDLFNELSAFNFSIEIQPTFKVHKKKYIVKSNNDKGEKSENNSIVFFNKMTIGNIGIHLYKNGSEFSIGYFSNPNGNSNLIINDIMHFNHNETSKRLLAIANEVLVILTDTNRLYLYSQIVYKCIREIEIDSEFKGVIHSMKEAKVNIPNERNKVLRYVCLCGEYIGNSTKLKQGVLFVYEYNCVKRDLILVAKIPKFPKPIYDVCCTKNYFITGMEGYLCLLPYELDAKTNGIIIKKEAKQHQYMNRIVSLYSIDNTNSNSVIVGDYKESFQLIDFEMIQSKFDVCAAEMSNRSLAKAIPLPHFPNGVMLLEKNGSITLFKMNNELYDTISSIDMKEYITNMHQCDEGIYLTGLLGSLYLIKVFDNKMEDEYELTIEKIQKLFVFQQTVFQKISQYYFGITFPIEKMMQMSCPLKNIILVDLLCSLCRYHVNIVKTIPDFDEVIKLLTFVNEDVI